MAVTKCAHGRPTHECFDADIRHKVCDQGQHKRVAAEWIPSHRLETEARNAQEREQIRRSGEVDLLAKMATRLPVPDYDPRRPEDITMCGGPADAFPWGAWPRDAAVTRTGKQAGKALRSQGHHCACVMRQSVSGSLPL